MADKEEAVVYTFACMYKYVDDLTSFCEEEHWDVDKMLDDKWNRLAIGGCMLYLGKLVRRIKKFDEVLYNNKPLYFCRIEEMGGDVIHDFDNILHQTMKTLLLHDVPNLQKLLVDTIPNELLEHPNSIVDGKYDLLEIYHNIAEKSLLQRSETETEECYFKSKVAHYEMEEHNKQNNEKIYTIDEIKQIAGPVFDKAGFVKEAYIFGSYARGEATPDSDIDFMVITNKPLDSYFLDLYCNLEKKFEKDVDVLTEEEYESLIFKKGFVKIYDSR